MPCDHCYHEKDSCLPPISRTQPVCCKCGKLGSDRVARWFPLFGGVCPIWKKHDPQL